MGEQIYYCNRIMRVERLRSHIIHGLYSNLSEPGKFWRRRSVYNLLENHYYKLFSIYDDSIITLQSE